MTTKIKIPTTSDYIKDTSRDYSIYVCEQRAIPNVSDGLKDSQRKALWTIRNKSEKIKTISLAGEMISGGLYLAGDTSAAMAISMLAAPYVNNVTLLDGIGAFGTRVAPVEGIGAPRYTYVKKNKSSDMLLYKDLDIVPVKDNYDGSTKQPEHFLPLIPLVLLNGVSGIAVGWSTDILPVTSRNWLQPHSKHLMVRNQRVWNQVSITWTYQSRTSSQMSGSLLVRLRLSTRHWLRLRNFLQT